MIDILNIPRGTMLISKSWKKEVERGDWKWGELDLPSFENKTFLGVGFEQFSKEGLGVKTGRFYLKYGFTPKSEDGKILEDFILFDKPSLKEEIENNILNIVSKMFNKNNEKNIDSYLALLKENSDMLVQFRN